MRTSTSGAESAVGADPVPLFYSRETMSTTGQKLSRGTVITGAVTGMHRDGRGVMTALNGAGDERTVVVRGAWPGDVVEAEIRRRRRGVFEAETVAVVEEATPRREPRCAHTSECGGCRWQEWPDTEQRRMKQHLTEQAFSDETPEVRIEVLPTLAVSSEFGYRNKMEFTFGRRKSGPDAGTLVLGLHRAGRFDWVFDLDRCYLCGERVSDVVAWVREWAVRHDLAAYDQRRHEGVLRHLVVREAGATGEMLVNLVAADLDIPGIDEFAELPLAFPEVTSLLLSLNTRKGDTAQAEHTTVLRGSDSITERVGPVSVEISAASFLQTNTEGAAKLYDIALRAADVGGSERVLDLYCGVGLIGLWFAPHVAEVIGVESVPEAVAEASRLSEQQGFENMSHVEGLAEDILPRWAAEGMHFDVAVIDPPRMGMHPKALSALIDLRPDRIVYVSCNPRTLAADIRELAQAGYTPGAVQPVDMFPQTAHVECVVRLDLSQN